MSRIRTVKPEHWSDKGLSNITLQAHLLWIGTWNFSDDKGVFENDPLLIKSQIFPRRTDIRTEQIIAWLDQLEKARYIIPFSYKDEGYYISRTFGTHQRIDKPTPSKIPEDTLRTILERSTNAREDSDLYSSVEESRVEEGREADKPPPRPKFVKPDESLLTDFFCQIGLDDFSAQAQAAKFLQYYDSVGWKIGGKSPMKDWKAAARNWKDRIKDFNQQKNGTTLTSVKQSSAANARTFFQQGKDEYNAVAARERDTNR